MHTQLSGDLQSFLNEVRGKEQQVMFSKQETTVTTPAIEVKLN